MNRYCLMVNTASPYECMVLAKIEFMPHQLWEVLPTNNCMTRGTISQGNNEIVPKLKRYYGVNHKCLSPLSMKKIIVLLPRV